MDPVDLVKQIGLCLPPSARLIDPDAAVVLLDQLADSVIAGKFGPVHLEPDPDVVSSARMSGSGTVTSGGDAVFQVLLNARVLAGHVQGDQVAVPVDLGNA